MNDVFLAGRKYNSWNINNIFSGKIQEGRFECFLMIEALLRLPVAHNSSEECNTPFRKVRLIFIIHCVVLQITVNTELVNTDHCSWDV